MNNLDESIGKILLELQKEDPDTFKKLIEKAQKDNPELFDVEIYEDNKKIDKYNHEIDEYNKKIDKYNSDY